MIERSPLPIHVIAEAIRGLNGSLTEEESEQWADKILEALGENNYEVAEAREHPF